MRPTTELEVLALCCLVVFSVWLKPISVPIWFAACLLIVALGLQSFKFLCFAVLILGSSLSNYSHNNYQTISSSSFSGDVVLIDDPESIGVAGTSALVKISSGNLQGSRVKLIGFGELGFDIRKLTAGDSLQLNGRIKSVKPSSWNKSRHLVGDLLVTDIVSVSKVSGMRSMPEYLRSNISESSKLLSYENRELYMGLVIGEDSKQSVAQKVQFRAAGMSHLLAVSGQNIALIFTMLAGLLQRLPLRMRFAVALLILVTFAIITRLEPSVLRASVVAAIAAWSAVTGGRSSGIRILCLAVIFLLLVDPFLIYSVGFILSVTASLGILLLSEGLIERLQKLKIPKWVSEQLAVTISAQVFVAPVLIYFFGNVPLVSVPANLAASWLSGFVMVTGSSLGLFIKYFPEAIAGVVMKPVELALYLLNLISKESTLLSWPQLGLYELLLLGVAILLCFLFSKFRLVIIGMAGITLCFIMFLPSDGAVVTSAETYIHIAGDSQFPSILIINTGFDKGRLEDYVSSGLGRVDIVIAQDGSRNFGLTTRALIDMDLAEVVLAPPLHEIPEATRITSETTVSTAVGSINMYPEERKLYISTEADLT